MILWEDSVLESSNFPKPQVPKGKSLVPRNPTDCQAKESKGDSTDRPRATRPRNGCAALGWVQRKNVEVMPLTSNSQRPGPRHFGYYPERVRKESATRPFFFNWQPSETRRAGQSVHRWLLLAYNRKSQKNSYWGSLFWKLPKSRCLRNDDTRCLSGSGSLQATIKTKSKATRWQRWHSRCHTENDFTVPAPYSRQTTISYCNSLFNRA